MSAAAHTRHSGSKSIGQPDFELLYPAIWAAFKRTHAKTPIPADVWSLFQDLQLLQVAENKTDIGNVVWALSVFSKASQEVEGRRAVDVAKVLICELPAKEHEAWYHNCARNGTLEQYLASHPEQQVLLQSRDSTAKSAAAVGVIFEDIRHRWLRLLKWQQDFLVREVSVGCDRLFREAQDIADVLNSTTFAFVLARDLIRVGKCSLALKVVCECPATTLAGAVEFGDPPRKHSYFELYSGLATHGSAKEASGFLDHVVSTGAYSDDALKAFIYNADLKDVIAFVISLVSYFRLRTHSSEGYSSAGLSDALDDLEYQTPRKARCWPFCMRGASRGSVSMLVRAAGIPHVLLRALLERYQSRDVAARDSLLHEREFLRAFEVVLLLGETRPLVRFVERLGDELQESLKICLLDWSRLHFIRILSQNRPPSYSAAAASAVVTGRELWVWTSTQARSAYFISETRDSKDIALVLQTFIDMCMFLDATIMGRFLTNLQVRDSQICFFDEFLPFGSELFGVVASEVNRWTPSLSLQELKLLMRSPGFYDRGVRGFLVGKSSELPRTVFHADMGYTRLMQLVMRLAAFHGGSLGEQQLESSIQQIGVCCQGNSLCLELMVRVFCVALGKPDLEFLPDGAKDIQSESCVFTIAGLAACSRRLREACDTIRNQAVQVTLGRVVDAFLATPPRSWVALFNALETVLFFLRLKEKENLDLAYDRFDNENAKFNPANYEMFSEYLAEARSYYQQPFVDMHTSVAELCTLDVRSAMARSKQLAECSNDDSGFRGRRGLRPEDWDVIVDIATCTAESMKEKYNVPMLPHHTQMITLLIFASQLCRGGARKQSFQDGGAGAVVPPSHATAAGRPKTVLAKVGTGEGKSWIIAMLAAFVAKKGLKAHVVIDNTTLLERDYATMSSLFQKLDVRAAKRDLGKHNQVVYCSSLDIEAYFMAEIQREGKASNLYKCAMIVDEVDSLIVDDNVYKCYVDEYQEGSAVCQWWCARGSHDNGSYYEPWRRRIIQKLEAAEVEMRRKKEGKDYVFDQYHGTLWALDERTSLLVRSAWHLWLELARKWWYPDYQIRYMTRQNIVSKRDCFSSYSFIFGLSGSLGTNAEIQYTKEQFGASFFAVPAFLDTCQGEKRPRASCVQTRVANNASEQLQLTAGIATKYCSSVPVVIVVRDIERVETVVDRLCAQLPDHCNGDRLGPGIIQLVDSPGREAEFQQLVDVSTQPFEIPAPDGGKPVRHWRITVTTAVGARGQDYHVSDDFVDEKGGLLLILEFVPDSEREWIQFLGRTARHDHPGQYAVILNHEEYRHAVDGFGTMRDSSAVVRLILDQVNKTNGERLAAKKDEIHRGSLMHHYTRQWWAWSKENRKEEEEHREKLNDWIDLCEQFETMTPGGIAKAFQELGIGNAEHPVLGQAVPHERAPQDSCQDQSVYHGQNDVGKEGKRNGYARHMFGDGRVYDGEWLNGKMTGQGRMTWPTGQTYEGQFLDDKKSGTGLFTWPDGRSYDGEWVSNKQHGRGTYSDAVGRSWTGEWNFGKKVVSGANAKVSRADSAETAADTAFYPPEQMLTI